MEKVYLVTYNINVYGDTCLDQKNKQSEEVCCKSFEAGLEMFKKQCLKGLRWYTKNYNKYCNNEKYDYDFYLEPDEEQQELTGYLNDLLASKQKNGEYTFEFSSEEHTWENVITLKEINTAEENTCEKFLSIAYKRIDSDVEKIEDYDDPDDARADFIRMTQEEADDYEYVILREVTTNYSDYEDIIELSEWYSKD